MQRLRYGLLAMLLVACTSHHGTKPTTAPGLPCADPADVAQLLTSTTLAGPAVGKDDGRRVTSAWSLDQGSITIGPPPDQAAPPVSSAQAGCPLAFALDTQTETVAKGKLVLATVTIDPRCSRPHEHLPAYQHRDAWVLVTAPKYSAPAGPAASDRVSTGRDGYQLLMVDARTGADLMSYAETTSPCPGLPSLPERVGVPMQRRSLAWTLVSRSADGGTVVVRASWRSCDVFSQPIADNGIVLPPHQVIGPGGAFLAAADHDNPTVISVQVVWPLGACGPEQSHDVTVGPAVAGAPLSADLGHAALGVLPYSQ